MNRIAFLLSLICLPLIAFSQSNFGSWYMSFNTIKFNQKWQFQNDIQYRTFNFHTDMEQLMLRGGFGYNLTKDNNNLLQGYALIRSGRLGEEPAEDENHFNEHRLYQQFITRQQFGRFYISHRYRVEERFLPSDFKIRFRYFLNVKATLSNKKMTDKTIYAAFYNELFINGQGVLFDRNRLFAAMGYAFTPSARLEIGVMSQIYQKSHRPQLQIGFFKTFDLGK